MSTYVIVNRRGEFYSGNRDSASTTCINPWVSNYSDATKFRSEKTARAIRDSFTPLVNNQRLKVVGLGIREVTTLGTSRVTY